MATLKAGGQVLPDLGHQFPAVLCVGPVAPWALAYLIDTTVYLVCV